ncbi:hypothetical protein [Salinisphaera hydrothermalis]|uniref:hypothetical protein n=1 Tax=Salinisphaera hydrothermalis TaxID=563188 RepID=UPI00333F42F3
MDDALWLSTQLAVEFSLAVGPALLSCVAVAVAFWFPPLLLVLVGLAHAGAVKLIANATAAVKVVLFIDETPIVFGEAEPTLCALALYKMAIGVPFGAKTQHTKK